MWKGAVGLVFVLAVVGSQAVAAQTAVAASGRVVTETVELPSRARAIEGVLQPTTIRRAGDGRAVASSKTGARLNVDLPAGRYVLSSASRTCAGTCETAGPPQMACSTRFQLPPRVTLRVRISRSPESRCRVRIGPHPVGVRGQSDRDRVQGASLLRYLRRTAGAAVWFPALRQIDVRSRVISVETSLKPGDPEARAAAIEICSAIQGSDVADFVRGHRVTGRGHRTVGRCRDRRE